MEETQIYNQRLHGITEKRRILTQVENIQRELEQQRLKLMQLKRKSLRDRWLMEGMSPAPEAEHDSPLAQTEGKIHQLQLELEGLQSRLIRLETPETNDIKAESTKISLETHLVNGERGQTSKIVEGYTSISEEGVHVVDQNTSGHPVPAPRAKKAETPETKQKQDEQNDGNEKQNAERQEQNHGEPVERRKSENGNLGQTDENLGPNLDQNSQNHVLKHATENQENQTQNEEHFNRDHNVDLSGEGAVPNSEETNEVHHPMSKLGAQNQSQEPSAVTEDLSQDQKSAETGMEATLITHDKYQDQNDQSTVKESSTFSDINQKNEQNQADASVNPDQNQEHISTAQNAESQSIPEDQNHVMTSTNEDQNHALTSINKEKNHVMGSTNEDQSHVLTSVSQAHYQDPVSEGQNPSHESKLILEDQEKNPKPVTQDQDPSSQTQDQSQDPIEPTQNQEPSSDDQRTEQTPFAQFETQSTGLLFRDPVQVHDSALPHQDQSQKPGLTSTDRIQDCFPIPEDQKPSNVMQSKNQVQVTQAHIDHVEVIAHGQESSPSQKVSSMTTHPTEEVEPLLHKTKAQSTHAPQATNTAESRKEKTRAKEKTCQCCVVM